MEKLNISELSNSTIPAVETNVCYVQPLFIVLSYFGDVDEFFININGVFQSKELAEDAIFKIKERHKAICLRKYEIHEDDSEQWKSEEFKNCEIKEFKINDIIF